MKKSIAIAFIFIAMMGCDKKESENDNLNSLTPLEKLEAGNLRFLDEKSIHPHQNKKSILENQNGQHPFAVVLTCSDSRVSPEILFDQGIGDLFIIRNAGNLISDIDMGSIEYAVEHLHTKLIVVLGHTDCGAIKAYVGDKNNEYVKHLNHIDDIVETIAKEEEEVKELKQHPKEKNLQGCIDANIEHSTKIIANNPIVKEHKTQIVSMLYDVHTGKAVKL